MYVSYSTTATSFKVILSNRRRDSRSSRRPPFTGAQSRHFSLETTAPPEKTKKQIFCQWQRVPGTSTGKKSPPLNRQLNIKLLSARGVRDGCVKRSGNTQRQQACFPAVFHIPKAGALKFTSLRLILSCMSPCTLAVPPRAPTYEPIPAQSSTSMGIITQVAWWACVGKTRSKGWVVGAHLSTLVVKPAVETKAIQVRA